MGLERIADGSGESGGSFLAINQCRKCGACGARDRRDAGRQSGGPGVMRNTWIICRKELRSYFVSPIAYLLLAMFAFIFGYFFYNIVHEFVRYGMAMQMRGEGFPLNVNEELVRPLLGNAGVVGLFLIPLITMRLFAEEKRNGTIELLTTSPVRDYEMVLGKWLASMALYGLMLLLTALNFIWVFKYG